MTRPSDAAIARAFWEDVTGLEREFLIGQNAIATAFWAAVDKRPRPNLSQKCLIARARAIDAEAKDVPAETEATALLRECREFYVRMFGFPADTTMTTHSAGAKGLIGRIDNHLASLIAETGAVVDPAIRELVDAVHAEFCCDDTEANEPDDSKVSHPEDRCHITFGMIRKARAAIASAPTAPGNWS